MHLLIILLQQLLGMLPGSKQVPQAEVVRNGGANPNSGEPDACGRIDLPLGGWMTPFETLCDAAGRLIVPFSARRHPLRHLPPASRASWPPAIGAALRRFAQAPTV